MKMICKYTSVLTLLISFNSCHYFATDYDKMLEGLYSKTVPLITSDSLSTLLANGRSLDLFDCRENAEYNVSHLKNAKVVGYNNFNINNLDLSKSDTIIVYCSVGYRSERIGEKLLKTGYQNVYNLYGGIFSWHNSCKTLVDNNDKITKKVHAYNKNWGKWLKAAEKIY